MWRASLCSGAYVKYEDIHARIVYAWVYVCMRARMCVCVHLSSACGMRLCVRVNTSSMKTCEHKSSPIPIACIFAYCVCVRVCVYAYTQTLRVACVCVYARIRQV